MVVFPKLFCFLPFLLEAGHNVFHSTSVSISDSARKLVKTGFDFYLIYFFSNILFFSVHKITLGQYFPKDRVKSKLFPTCKAFRFVAFHSAELKRILSNSLNATFCIIFNWRMPYVKIIFIKNLGMQLNIFK